MKTYISILRGINVSGHRLIKMDDLKKRYLDLGFSNVRSYIQSGNVIFNHSDINCSVLEQQISTCVKSTYGFDVPVLVFDYLTFKRLIESNPFISNTTIDPKHLHITFLSNAPDTSIIDSFTSLYSSDNDDFICIDRAFYLHTPNGYSNSKLSNGLIENKLKVTATTRNWKTSNELLKIADEINKQHQIVGS